MLACSGTNLAIMPSTTIAFALLRWTHAGPAGPTLGCAVAAPAGAAAVLAGFAGGAAGFFAASAAPAASIRARVPGRARAIERRGGGMAISSAWGKGDPPQGATGRDWPAG